MRCLGRNQVAVTNLGSQGLYNETMEMRGYRTKSSNCEDMITQAEPLMQLAVVIAYLCDM